MLYDCIICQTCVCIHVHIYVCWKVLVTHCHLLYRKDVPSDRSQRQFLSLKTTTLKHNDFLMKKMSYIDFSIPANSRPVSFCLSDLR